MFSSVRFPMQLRVWSNSHHAIAQTVVSSKQSDINILNMCNQVDPTIEIPQRWQKLHAPSNTLLKEWSNGYSFERVPRAGQI